MFSVVYVGLNVMLIKAAGAVGLIAANSLSILLITKTWELVLFMAFFRIQAAYLLHSSSGFLILGLKII